MVVEKFILLHVRSIKDISFFPRPQICVGTSVILLMLFVNLCFINENELRLIKIYVKQGNVQKLWKIKLGIFFSNIRKLSCNVVSIIDRNVLFALEPNLVIYVTTFSDYPSWDVNLFSIEKASFKSELNKKKVSR